MRFLIRRGVELKNKMTNTKLWNVANTLRGKMNADEFRK